VNAGKMIAPCAFLALAQAITKTSPTKAHQKVIDRFVSTFVSKHP
jgi:hypothetical protein